MNDTQDWNDVSESNEACGDDDDDGTCRRLNACLSPGGGAGFVGIGYGSGRAGIETPQPVPPHLRTSENVDQNPRPFSSDDSQIFSSARLREGVPG